MMDSKSISWISGNMQGKIKIKIAETRVQMANGHDEAASVIFWKNPFRDLR